MEDEERRRARAHRRVRTAARGKRLLLFSGITAVLLIIAYLVGFPVIFF